MTTYPIVPKVLDRIIALAPRSILEIGVGCSNLQLATLLAVGSPQGDLAPRQVTIDGVTPCSVSNSVYEFAYNRLYIGDIAQLIDPLPCYDCIVFMGGLEDFSRQDGLLLMEKLLAHCNKELIVSTPFYKEGGDKAAWSIVDFVHFNFTYERVEVDKNGRHIFYFSRAVQVKNLPFATVESDKNLVRKPLTIGYLLPNRNLTGGMKMLLQQMKYLKNRGHKIIAFLKDSNRDVSILPDWFDLTIDCEVTVPPNHSFLSYIGCCDVVMSGWVTQLGELQDSTVPVIYWEQGHEWLFGDIAEPGRVEEVAKMLDHCYLSKHAIVSVSPYVRDSILARYGRKTPVLSNGIDTDFYCPGAKSGTNKILLVGNPSLAFKSFDSTFKALYAAWTAGYPFHVEWVCQTEPKVPKMPFPISIIVQPTQQALVACYQSADLHLFTSWYEGFGMPPLEAMACATPVVCTNCGGTDAFVRHGYNALTADAGDIAALTANIISLLTHPELCKTLGENGRITAQKLDYSSIISDLENNLYAIVQQK